MYFTDVSNNALLQLINPYMEPMLPKESTRKAEWTEWSILSKQPAWLIEQWIRWSKSVETKDFLNIK